VRVIVTGAAGFLGRYTVAELLRRGHDVDAVVRPSRALPAELEQPGVHVVRADLRTGVPVVAERLPGAAALVHLASSLTGTVRERFDGTVLATEALVGALAEQAWTGRMVHVSSFAVYAFGELSDGSVVDELAPVERDPGRRDLYAWTKLWQERVVREAAAQYGLDVTVVRPGAVYGPERRSQPRLGRPLGAHGLLLLGGSRRMPLSYVENTASLLAECAENPKASGQVLNAVDPHPLRQWEYLRRWQQAGDGPTRVVLLPVAAFRALGRGYALAGRLSGGTVRAPGLFDPYANAPTVGRFQWDGSLAGRVLGWIPPVTVPDALDRTFGARHVG